MELVSLYIQNFKGISDLWVPCNSRFTLQMGDNKQIRIAKNPYGARYYQGTSCTLLLGKNGAGKTTVLEFIEALFADADHSGTAVWYQGSHYVMQTINMPSPDVIFDEGSIVQPSLLVIPELLKTKNHALLKISNINDITKVLFNDRRRKPRIITDRSLSKLTVSQKSKSNELDKIIDYLERAPCKPESLTEINILPGVYFTPPSQSRIKDIIQRYQNDDEFTERCINLFYENMVNIKNHNITIPFLSNDKIPDSSEYIKFKKHYQRSLYSLIRSITEPNVRNDISLETMIRSLIPSLVWAVFAGIKEQKLKEQLTITTLIHLAFFSLHEIPGKLKQYTTSQLPKNMSIVEELSIDAGIAMVENELETLFEIFGILSINTVNMTLYDERILFSSRETGNIITADDYIEKLTTPCIHAFTMYWSGLSSGESAIIYLLSNVWEELQKQRNYPDKNLLILIDEVDLYLHPEWQRTILSYIIKLINTVRPDGRVQLIMSTHSPIIASDFLPNDTVTLTKMNNKIVIDNTAVVGFGSTISELMMENFFLDATIGKLAFDEITTLLDDKIISSPDAEYLKSQIKNEVLKKMLEIKDDLN